MDKRRGYVEELVMCSECLLIGIVFFLVVCPLPPSTAKPNNEKTTRNMSQLLDQLLHRYDRRLRPGFGGNIFYIQKYIFIYIPI